MKTYFESELLDGIEVIESDVNSQRDREFPFFWIKKPSMATLQVLASHLREKSQLFSNDSGFRGEATPMERQIIERVSTMRQQICLLTDVVEGALQILDDNRPSQRAKQAFQRVRNHIINNWRRMEKSPVYKALAAIGVLTTLWVGLSFLAHHIR